jgi:hypothetical protein
MPEGWQEIPRRGSYKSCLQKQQEEDRRKKFGVFAERRR